MLEWFTEVISYLAQLDIEEIEELLDRYSALGPIPGILLPTLEALIPILPLFVIVAANASAYGLWLGFAYSTIGSVLGAFLVFMIANRFGTRVSDYLTKKHPKAELFFNWIKQRGFTPLFLLYSFPFTPSFVVNLAAGVCKVPLQVFLPALALGKSIMIMCMSLIGHDWQGFIFHPWRLILLALGLFILWYIGKRIEKYYQLN